jgi:hypothetical protein
MRIGSSKQFRSRINIFLISILLVKTQTTDVPAPEATEGRPFNRREARGAAKYHFGAILP